MNVSRVELVESAEQRITALPAPGTKCTRCWNYATEIANYGAWENVCLRCQAALKEMGIAPPEPAA